MTTITLPWPPGVNNLFATYGKRRIRTRRYEAWIVEATVQARQQRPEPVKGPFGVHATFTRPDRRRIDLDGRIKAPLDLLVKLGVIEDDSLAQIITMAWSNVPPGKPGGCQLIVLPVAVEV